VAPEAYLRCFRHPDVQAATRCDRCGHYLCEPCLAEHPATCRGETPGEPSRERQTAILGAVESVVALVSALTPLAVYVAWFLDLKLARGLAVAVPITCLVISLVVYANTRPRYRIALSVALTNLVGCGMALGRLGCTSLSLIVITLSPSFGLLLAIDAILRGESAPRTTMFAVLAPIFWFGMLLMTTLLAVSR